MTARQALMSSFDTCRTKRIALSFLSLFCPFILSFSSFLPTSTSIRTTSSLSINCGGQGYTLSAAAPTSIAAALSSASPFDSWSATQVLRIGRVLSDGREGGGKRGRERGSDEGRDGEADCSVDCSNGGGGRERDSARE